MSAKKNLAAAKEIDRNAALGLWVTAGTVVISQSAYL
jgi:hypothetical protein